MSNLFGLLAAFTYGAADFAAGLASRRVGSGPVTAAVQFLGLVTAAFAVVLFPGSGPNIDALAWGALSGVGSAIGVLALYRGLEVGQMSVVAPLSAVIAALLPIIIGLTLGETLSTGARLGVALALPAIGLISWHPRRSEISHARSGVIEGVLSGAGFALLFIALDQAGGDAGAWPLIPGQAVAFLLALPFGWSQRQRLQWRTATTGLILLAGILGGLANLFFLAATVQGRLSIAAVLTSLYPAVTILLARVILGERWTALQSTGLIAAAAAVVLISAN